MARGTRITKVGCAPMPRLKPAAYEVLAAYKTARLDLKQRAIDDILPLLGNDRPSDYPDAVKEAEDALRMAVSWQPFV